MLTTTITTKRALNLIWNFHNRKSYKKTAAVIFKIKELKAYIDLCISEGDDEMKLYFGQYSIKNNPGIKIPDYDERQTIIFVPLKKGVENIPKPFSQPPLNEGELCPPKTGCDGSNTLYYIIQTGAGGFDPDQPD